MAPKCAILFVAVALGACSHRPYDLPDRGVEAVNVPVVSRSDYVFDAAAPGGSLAPGEASRLDAWFRSLDLRYGDTIYVDGGYSDAVRAQVVDVAGQYGLIVAQGAPVTPGAVPPGTVRVVVSRTVASVPGCPNWSRPAQPNYNNQSLPSFGCGVNSNLAAMVANPEDLVHGQQPAGSSDAPTVVKSISVYRTQDPTGKGGLKDISTRKN
jgi:pilus assembly protein CpaD